MKLPEQVPIMVLSNAVLFPQALLPLRIFEPRYRQMLEDCLMGERIFSIGLLKKGWEADLKNPPFYDVIGVGLIRASVGQEDGTSLLALQGMTRARVVKLVKRRPYCLAEIESLQSTHTDCVTVDALVGRLMDLIRQLSGLGVAAADPILESYRKQKQDESLADLAAFVLLRDQYQQQAMLEQLDLRERLRCLNGFLQERVKTLDFEQKLKGQRNTNN